MNAKPLDIRRNRLADAFLLLIEAAEQKTAAASQTVQAQDAATVETPVNQKANGQGHRTMRAAHRQKRGGARC